MRAKYDVSAGQRKKFIQFGIRNYEVRSVGDAEEEVGWEKYHKKYLKVWMSQ